MRRTMTTKRYVRRRPRGSAISIASLPGHASDPGVAKPCGLRRPQARSRTAVDLRGEILVKLEEVLEAGGLQKVAPTSATNGKVVQMQAML